MLERISNQKLPTPKRRKVDDDENGGDDFEKIFQLYKKWVTRAVKFYLLEEE